MKEKDLSVIIPVYNTKLEILERCILSITKLQNIEYEILLINDGSEEIYSKEYELLLKKYEDVPINYIYKENGGVSSARNLGLLRAVGKYITLVDSDDVLHQNAFVSKYFEMDADIVQFNRIHMYKDKEIIARELDAEPGYIEQDKLLKEFICNDSLYCPWGKIIKKDFLEKNNIVFREEMISGEDAIFNLDMLLCSPKFYYTNQSGYVYYVEVNNAKKRLLKNPERCFEDFYYLYKRKRQIINSEEINDTDLLRILKNRSINLLFQMCMDYSAQKENLEKYHNLSTKYLKKIDIKDIDITQKGRIQYDLILGEHWFTIMFISYIRKIYLRYIKQYWWKK